MNRSVQKLVLITFIVLLARLVCASSYDTGSPTQFIETDDLNNIKKIASTQQSNPEVEPLKQSEFPSICYAVFPTIKEAARYCPNRNYLVKVHDVWTGQFSGYSCYCDGLLNEWVSKLF